MQGPKWTEEQRAARLDGLVARNRAGHSGAFLYEDREWMLDAYAHRALTLRQVADEAGCSLRTVARWMQVHDIPTRSDARSTKRGPEHPAWKGGPKLCPDCGRAPSHRSKTKTCLECRPREGEANSNWRGDQIRNPQAHSRVKKLRGPASQHSCAHCGRRAAEWAYDHLDPHELPDPEGPYSLDPDHYMALCVPCHRKFDATPHHRSVGE